MHYRVCAAGVSTHALQQTLMTSTADLLVGLSQVAHLVVIETDQMYYNRKVAEHAAASLRPPVTIRHNIPTLSPAAQQAWQAAQQQQQQQQRL